MKAVVINNFGAENLEIRDVDEPSGGIKVMVKKAGLNPLDYNLIAGKVVYGVSPMPHIPGSEIMGIAMEDGKNIKKGDRVIVYNRIFDGSCEMCISGNEHLCYNGGIWGVVTNGGYSEYISVDEKNLFKVPDVIDDNTAVSIGIGALTAYRAIKMARPAPGSKILVYGAGNTGIFTVQIARIMGLDVYVYSRKNELGKFGITVFNKIPDDFQADTVINPLGNGLLSESLKYVKRRGKLITYGVLTGRNFEADIADIYTNEKQIIGSTGGTRQDLYELLKIMSLNRFYLPVYMEYSLWNIKKALEDFTNRETGRIILNL
ncbi:alcohol dehydrogenase [Acidiplasma aeolicum]|uniref:Alcohol dehydrogenase n=1 Tax=Acidiplasma aeolicum TaxID=507754 RepID=A0A0P9F4U2_9ARCH|nr:alcohol dehydrogenase catalytic domain-containing protein [Acidiplasma aeolicum]KPV46823.1 alcohol dehydrogenase [Acidiplasma aeolicum]KPV46828.1 alcohol dehydrogenase [Acidiplasma aeolicum]